MRRRVRRGVEGLCGWFRRGCGWVGLVFCVQLHKIECGLWLSHLYYKSSLGNRNDLNALSTLKIYLIAL